MMKYTPRVRREMAPMTRASSADTSTASGQLTQALRTPSAMSIATV